VLVYGFRKWGIRDDAVRENWQAIIPGLRHQAEPGAD
jgi:hypothetical protein